MQENLNVTIDEINNYIMQTNKDNSVATPHCHSAIRKRSGKGRYRLNWDGLKDGVHGNSVTRTLWSKSIAAAIKINRK